MQNIRKSAFMTGLGNIEVKENEIPEVGDNDILLKVYSCAICGSDIRILKSGNSRIKYPQITGHEVAGEIVKIGKAVKNFKVSDRICLGADVPCGKCYYCTHDMGNCCDINYAIGYQFEGGFSEYMHLNETVVKYGPVHKIPDNLDYDTATLAEPLACCINGYERGFMDLRKNSDIVIFGAGPIGIMLALLAPAYEAKNVFMIDPNVKRLQRAKEEFGIKTVIDPDKENVIEKIFEYTQNKGADMIFTACTAVETHENAIKMLAKRGVVNLFGGLPKDSRAASFYSNDIHYKEAYITGSHGSTPSQHKKALDLISQNKINLKGIITDTYSLDEIHKAFEKAASGDAVKVVVNPNKWRADNV